MNTSLGVLKATEQIYRNSIIKDILEQHKTAFVKRNYKILLWDSICQTDREILCF